MRTVLIVVCGLVVWCKGDAMSATSQTAQNDCLASYVYGQSNLVSVLQKKVADLESQVSSLQNKDVECNCASDPALLAFVQQLVAKAMDDAKETEPEPTPTPDPVSPPDDTLYCPDIIQASTSKHHELKALSSTSGDGNEVDATVVAYCEADYTAKPTPTTGVTYKCKLDETAQSAQWTWVYGTCVADPVYCPSTIAANPSRHYTGARLGTLFMNEREVGDITNVSCDTPDYTGQVRLKCSSTGEWEWLDGTCNPRIKYCSSSIPANSARKHLAKTVGSTSARKINDTTNANCFSGYSGTVRYKCTTAGWQWLTGSCIVINNYCPDIIQASTSKHHEMKALSSTSTMQLNDTATASCSSGYTGSVAYKCTNITNGASYEWAYLSGSCTASSTPEVFNGPWQPSYSGRCTKSVMTKTECEAAARTLTDSGTTATVRQTSVSNRPVGCYTVLLADWTVKLYFNDPNGTKVNTGTCASALAAGGNCVCRSLSG